MAITNLNLNVRANTARALRDFKRFSDTLDNKFLVNGLKLDVIRSSLSQINREFQRSIGEQGLASASSLRAAQNQAALLTQTFKGFASESALAINREIGTALNSLAVRAGGTMKDVQKTISAASFVSIKMPQGEREQLLKDMMSLQRDMRRAGVTENFGGIAQQFLSGRVQAMDLIGSEDAGAAFIGAEILKRSGGRAQITDPRQRSQILAEVVSDPAIIAQFKEMARRTMGYRLVLEDLNTRLFNPEMGLFGSLRKVLGADGRYTTMFDQVEKLANTVFGPEGPFATFFRRIRDVFKIEDPMQPLIGLVQFTTKISEDINTFLQGDIFGGILRGIKRLFDEISSFIQGPTVAKAIEDIKTGFRKLSQYLESEKFAELVGSVKSTFGQVFDVLRGISGTFASFIEEVATGSFEPEGIKESIKDIGETVRQFIKDVGQNIRDYDLDRDGGEGEFFAEIAGTLFSELGKTAVVLFKELFATLIDKIPEVAALVLPQLNNGINAMLTEMFGAIGGKVVKFVLGAVGGFLPGPVGAIARASAAGDITGGGGNMFSMAAMGAAALMGPGALFGAGRVGRGLFGGDQARFGLLQSLTSRVSPVEEMYNLRMRQLYLPGMQRYPISRSLADLLAPRSLTDSTGGPTGGGGGGGRGPFRGFDPRDPFGTQRRARMEEVQEARALRRERNRAIREGRITAATSVLAGTIDYDVPSSNVFRPRFGRITPETTMFRPIAPDMPNPRRITRETTMFQPPTAAELFPFLATPGGPQQGRERNRTRLAFDRMRANWRGEDSPAPEIVLGPEYLENLRDQNYKSGFGRFFSPLMETPVDRNRGRGSGGGRFARKRGRFRGPRLTTRNGLIASGLLLGGIAINDLSKGTNAQEMLSSGIQQVSENKGFGEVFNGVSQGAAIGGVIGTAVPVIGNVAGAVIGGVIGGVMPLLDKETRESIGQLFSGLRSAFSTTVTNLSTGFETWRQNTWRYFVEGTRENFRKATDFLGSGLRFVANGLISVFNNILTGFQLIPRLIIGLVEKTPFADKIPGFEAAKNAANFQIPTIQNNYGGKDFYGPAMALEARMSGRKPMIVNDGEFVIPSGSGMATLSNLVGQNLQATGVLRQNQSREVSINVQLVVNNSAFVSNADELADRLRAPVHQIINEAWTKVTQTVPYRPA